jgi:hypothetical protein
MVLGKKVNLKDLEAVDYELHKGLNWMLCVAPFSMDSLWN